MIRVANNEDDRPVRVREIADTLGIPFPTLAKIVQKLTRESLLASQKGPGGGITLSRPAADLTLLEVVEAIEGRHLSSECILGVAGCSERMLHCPLHGQWKGIREALVTMLEKRTLETVAAEMTETELVRGDAVRRELGQPRSPRALTKARARGSAGT